MSYQPYLWRVKLDVYIPYTDKEFCQGYEDGKIILHVFGDDNKVESNTLKEWSDLGE